MSKMYTQHEAEERIKHLGNGNYKLISPYRGSNEYHTFEHLQCGAKITKSWSNFIDAFRSGSPHYKCINCKI